METLVAMQVVEAPEHPVLPRASRYDVRELRLAWSVATEGATLELEASTHEEYVTLRFAGIEELYVPCGELIHSIRLLIQDTSQCPSTTLRILPVRVGGTESQGCALRFWAKPVERVQLTHGAP